MKPRQTSSNGPHDGDASLLVAILNRMGIAVIIVAGVLIAPAGIPEFPVGAFAPGATASDLPESPTWSRTEQVSRPAKPSPGEIWKVMEPAQPVNGIDIRDDTSHDDVVLLQTTAEADSATNDDSPLRQVFRKLGTGLRRLVGGFELARDVDGERDQRIPASFIPSRS